MRANAPASSAARASSASRACRARSRSTGRATPAPEQAERAVAADEDVARPRVDRREPGVERRRRGRRGRARARRPPGRPAARPSASVSPSSRSLTRTPLSQSSRCGRGTSMPGHVAQRAGDAALLRGLVLEVELVERQLAQVAQHRGRVEVRERGAQRRGRRASSSARSLRTDALDARAAGPSPRRRSRRPRRGGPARRAGPRAARGRGRRAPSRPAGPTPPSAAARSPAAAAPRSGRARRGDLALDGLAQVRAAARRARRPRRRATIAIRAEGARRASPMPTSTSAREGGREVEAGGHPAEGARRANAPPRTEGRSGRELRPSAGPAARTWRGGPGRPAAARRAR